MLSDWIAHEILDSVVDAFFPYLEEIEKEVLAIEDIVFSGEDIQEQDSEDLSEATSSSLDTMHGSEGIIKKLEAPESLQEVENEKNGDGPPTTVLRGRLSIAVPPSMPLLRRLKRFFKSKLHLEKPLRPTIQKNTPLRRMARIRRLVTSLGRLLASKSEVVAQLRKRLVTGLGSGSKTEDIEVAMYLGDVQGSPLLLDSTELPLTYTPIDHIYSLQHSLAHYERMLSQSHPTYLSQLRTNAELTKSDTDKVLVYLAVISTGVLCMQLITGSCLIPSYLNDCLTSYRLPRNQCYGSIKRELPSFWRRCCYCYYCSHLFPCACSPVVG